MATMAEEFKEDFEQRFCKSEWCDFDEFTTGYGFNGLIDSKDTYEKNDLAFVEALSGREYIIFKDRSWVVVEYWTLGADPTGIYTIYDGKVFIMPTPEYPTQAEKARSILEENLGNPREIMEILANGETADGPLLDATPPWNMLLKFKDGTRLRVSEDDGCTVLGFA